MQKEQDFPMTPVPVSFLHADSIKAKAIPVSKFLTPWLAEHNENLLGSNFNCPSFSVSIHNQVMGGGTQRYLRKVQREHSGENSHLIRHSWRKTICGKGRGRAASMLSRQQVICQTAKEIANRKERGMWKIKKNDLGDIAWVAKDDLRDKESIIGMRRFESALEIDSLPLSATLSP